MNFPHPMDDKTGFEATDADMGLPVYCERCEREIDPADKYARCTDPWGGNVEFVCETCREQAYDRDQERLMETGGGPSLIEQQREAFKIKHGIPS